jgi:aminomethyltransferase
MAVRQNVGIFDVSHMSNLWVKGPDAAKLLSKCTMYNPDKLKIGQAKYSAFPRDDATIIDDTIFMKFEDGFFVVPNAGMNEIITAWLQEQAKRFNFNVEVSDHSKEYAIIAVQGPKAEALMQNFVGMDITKAIFGKFKCAKTKVCGIDAILSRTGYTGEDGFEINLSAKDAENVFMAIFEKGKECGIRACGLGCRDTLRLEKAMMLAGHEFHGGRTPVEAGIDWAASWTTISSEKT